MEEEKVKQRWKEYFDNLLNQENPRAGILKLGGAPPLGGVKALQGGREHDSDILMKSSSELQSNLVTTSLLIHYIRICDLVLKNNFV